MTPLTFADTHNMVAFLSKFDASDGFDQIVDFINAHIIKYALVVNPTIYVSCIKQFWATATIKKVNDVVQLRALIDGKKVVVSEAIIRRDLHLDDAYGVECLLNKEIFEELVRMGYEKPPPKLTFYKAFFSTQWKFLIHTLVQCLSSKRTAWNPTPTPHSTSLQDQPSTPHSLPPQEQPTATSESSMSLLTTLMETCATLSQKVAKLEQDKHSQDLEILQLKKRVKKLEKKISLSLQAINADEDITLVDVKKDKEVVAMDVKPQERINQEDVNVATNGVSTAEPTVFDDEEIAQKLHDEEVEKAAVSDKQEKDDMERAQVLQKQYDGKAKNIDWKKYDNLFETMVGYKMEHFRGMTYDKVKPIFKREYKKVQTLFKPDKDVEEPKKKRVVDETLLQESFKKLRAAEVSGSESTQEIPSNDLKEMSEKEVQNMLEINLVSEFKVKALQVKYLIIDWEIYTEVPSVDKEKALWVELKWFFKPDVDDVLWKLQRYIHAPLTWNLYTDHGVHQVSLIRGHDIFMLTEKDYPLSNVVMILMLSGKLQVKEDNEMARDLVMKIFMEANKPKSKSLDTFSK
uniref:Xylulose kinase-1 n=1 Tax=Tanacetum cinerariifolium TaxID=118510 RepID=A0A699IW97_TANCI|nr:hypothetical protein [Tanacetum cinerariifolium]